MPLSGDSEDIPFSVLSAGEETDCELDTGFDEMIGEGALTDSPPPLSQPERITAKHITAASKRFLLIYNSPFQRVHNIIVLQTR